MLSTFDPNPASRQLLLHLIYPIIYPESASILFGAKALMGKILHIIRMDFTHVKGGLPANGADYL